MIEGRGDHRLQGLVLRAGDSGARQEVDAVALFVLIGAVPHTPIETGVRETAARFRALADRGIIR